MPSDAQLERQTESMKQYVLTDADGKPIPGERYTDKESAIEALLMWEHEDNDRVAVEKREY